MKNESVALPFAQGDQHDNARIKKSLEHPKRKITKNSQYLHVKERKILHGTPAREPPENF